MSEETNKGRERMQYSLHERFFTMSPLLVSHVTASLPPSQRAFLLVIRLKDSRTDDSGDAGSSSIADSFFSG